MAPGEWSDTSSADPDRFHPDGVVLFAIAEREARDRAARWLRRSWFAPGRLVRLVRSDALERRYLPFWVFDAHALGYWSGPGVMRGIIEMDFPNLLIPADRAADSSWLPELDPATAKDVRPYASREIGVTAVADAQRGFMEAESMAHARMEGELVAAVKRSRPATERDKLSMSRIEYARETCRGLLLPIWLLDYRHLGRRYRIVIDGASGRVAGEAPKSLAKAALVTILLLWLILLFGDAETALSLPQRMADGLRWLVWRSISG